MRLSLTDEQKAAATAQADLVYIEASPGSGKTTVATERYGIIRYSGARDPRGVIAVSFARSARGELAERVRRRWGSDATRWPHKVWTLDSLHRALLQHLLRAGAIVWPNGHTELVTLDSWRGQPGCRPVDVGQWIREVRLNEGKVESFARRGRRSGRFITQAAPHKQLLEQGFCTHDEVRQVLVGAFRSESLRDAVGEYLRSTMRALIVDEIFDGNPLDLALVALAAQMDVPTTIIGDPWQALYAFRGATPHLVPNLLEQLDFSHQPINESFRFRTDEMKELASELRAGNAVQLPVGSPADVDVVLASEWAPLWSAADEVLPLSFGQPDNRLDAAIAVLLDQVVSSHFRHLSTFGPEAAAILGLSTDDFRNEVADLLAPVVRMLPGADTDGATAALHELRDRLREHTGTTIRQLQPSNRARRIANLAALGRRLTGGYVVPGMTIHQAKGREWERVGVVLREGEVGRLAAGLEQESENHRKLYVALTRAKDRTVRIT